MMDDDRTNQTSYAVEGVMNLSTKHHIHEQRQHNQQVLPVDKSSLPQKPVQMVYPAVHKMHSYDGQSREKDSEKLRGPGVDDDSEDFVESDLLVTPLRRRERYFVPDERKDSRYWSKRIRNNMAAKRSREKRRYADVLLESKVSKLAQENEDLKSELANIKQLVQKTLVNGPLQERMRYARCDADVLDERRKDVYLSPPCEKRAQLGMNLQLQGIPSLQPPPRGSFHAYIPPVRQVPPMADHYQPVELLRVPRSEVRPALDPLMMSQGLSARSVPSGPYPPFPPAQARNPNTLMHPPWSEQPWGVQRVPDVLPSQRRVELEPKAPSTNPFGAPASAELPSDFEHLHRDVSHKEKDNHKNIVFAVPNARDVPTCLDETTSFSKFPPISLSTIAAASPPCKDSDSSSASLSPTLSQHNETLTTAEINKLPHKLRAKMLRTLSLQQEHSEHINGQEATSVTSQHETVPKHVNEFDENILKNIKKEKEDYDVINDHSEAVCSLPGPPPAEIPLIPPKQEFPGNPLRSIEDELEQARNLIPTPSPTMNPEESEAYMELVKAASDLIGARFHIKDFSAPTARQITRKRTRDMSVEEKYRYKRVRNNIAAKKCRDAKRMLTDYRAARSNFFQIENVTLKNELEKLSKGVIKLREMVRMKNISTSMKVTIAKQNPDDLRVDDAPKLAKYST